MPQMVVDVKRNQKAHGVGYKKVLNKKDPFDQLILELGQTGVLDVSIVGIGDKASTPLEHEYSRKPVPQKGKHTS
jgi:hypothetical protein